MSAAFTRRRCREPLRWRPCPACVASASCDPSAVGLYVPAGSAPLPSAVDHARRAGAHRRLPESGALHAARHRQATPMPRCSSRPQLCGIETVFKVGGAQAIAALAYGTADRSQGRQDLRTGQCLGHRRQAARRRAIRTARRCDLPAGPSEVLVIADETARAELRRRGLAGAGRARCAGAGDSRHARPGAALPQRLPRQFEVQMRSCRVARFSSKSLAASRCIVVPTSRRRRSLLRTTTRPSI